MSIKSSKNNSQGVNEMMELLNNLVLMGEAAIEFAKNLVIYAGGGVGGLALLVGGFKFLRKL